MVWFYITDGFPEHPKVLAIPRDLRLGAVGLWSVCGAWSAQQLTDGHVSTSLAVEKGGTRAQIRALVDSGLWHSPKSACPHTSDHCPRPAGKNALVFHDWFDWQRSRERVLAERRQKAEAGRAGGQASGASRRSRPRSGTEAPASPVVEPPVLVRHPTPNPRLLRLVGHRLFGDARDERLSDDLVGLWHNAVGDGDLEIELRNFLIHNTDTHLHNPSAALLGWLARAAERAATPGPRPVLGCPDCRSGWLPDHPDTGMPVPCPTCKPHRYHRQQAT